MLADSLRSFDYNGTFGFDKTPSAAQVAQEKMAALQRDLDRPEPECWADGTGVLAPYQPATAPCSCGRCPCCGGLRRGWWPPYWPWQYPPNVVYC